MNSWIHFIFLTVLIVCVNVNVLPRIVFRMHPLQPTPPHHHHHRDGPGSLSPNVCLMYVRLRTIE